MAVAVTTAVARLVAVAPTGPLAWESTWSQGALPLRAGMCCFHIVLRWNGGGGLKEQPGLLKVTCQGTWRQQWSTGDAVIYSTPEHSSTFCQLGFLYQRPPLSSLYTMMWPKNCSEPGAGVLRVGLILGLLYLFLAASMWKFLSQD